MSRKPTTRADAKGSNDDAASTRRISNDARRSSHSSASPPLIVRNDRFFSSTGKRMSRVRRSIQPAQRLPLRKRLRDNDQEETTAVNDKEPSLVTEKPRDVEEMPPPSKKARRGSVTVAGPASADTNLSFTELDSRSGSSPALPAASSVPAAATRHAKDSRLDSTATANGSRRDSDWTGNTNGSQLDPDWNLSPLPVDYRAQSAPTLPTVPAPLFNANGSHHDPHVMMDSRPGSAPTLPTVVAVPRSYPRLSPNVMDSRPSSAPTLPTIDIGSNLAANGVEARPGSAPTLPTTGAHGLMGHTTGSRPGLANTEAFSGHFGDPAAAFAPTNVPYQADPNLAPGVVEARPKAVSLTTSGVPAPQMRMPPPQRSHHSQPQSNEQLAWSYGWGTSQPGANGAHEGSVPTQQQPVDYRRDQAPGRASRRAPAARKNDDDSYAPSDDEATLDSDEETESEEGTESVSSNSTDGAALHEICVTQNGGLLLKNSSGALLALIDSDTANVSKVFKDHKIQVTNLSGHNAINTLKSLATVAPVKAEHRKFQRWTDDEDDLLRSAISKSGQPPYNWSRISRKYFRGIRTSVQCKNRWMKVLDPGLKRTPWMEEEDAMIRRQKEAGTSWNEIAKLLPGRLAENIKDRWVTKLDPSLKKGPWSDEENEILYKAQARLGNKWKEISALLPGRSENAVKNRWHNAKTSQRRKLKQLAKASQVLDRLEEARGTDDSD